MNESKTIEELKRFYKIISSGDPQSVDREYIRFFSLKMAESIISDLGDTTATEIANIILVVAEKPYESNKDPYRV